MSYTNAPTLRQDASHKFANDLVLQIPASFDPCSHLDESLWKYADNARYFMWLVYAKHARGDVDSDGLVRIQAEYLKNVMHQGSFVQIKDQLADTGAVDKVGGYVVKKHPYRYRPSELYKRDRLVNCLISDQRLIRQFHKYYRPILEEQAAKLPVDLELERLQTLLEIDLLQADEILKDLPPESAVCQDVLCQDIAQGRWRYAIPPCRRRFNNVTALKRELRQCLYVQGEPLVALDIANSQPALLGKLVTESILGPAPFNYDSKALPADLREYNALVQAGGIYEAIVEERLTHRSRSHVKQGFLRDFLAKRGSYHSDVEEAVRGMFPTVADFRDQVNHDDHGNLIRRLQREEAGVVVEGVCNDFVSANPGTFAVTLHDAIFCRRSDLPKVQIAFSGYFARSGFSMATKTQG